MTQRRLTRWAASCFGLAALATSGACQDAPDCRDTQSCTGGPSAGAGGTSGAGGADGGGATSGIAGSPGTGGSAASSGGVAGASGAADGGDATGASSGASGAAGADGGPTKPSGASCDDDVECTSGHCVDSTCCSAASCDDGLACNGVELCGTGTCAGGTPPTCAPTDPTRCTAACTEGGPSGYTCVTSAKDADGDGRGDENCAAAPGDDCNDADRAIFPGAPELCDGVDNDCDAKLDLDDGLRIGGSNVAFADVTAGNLAPTQIVFDPVSRTYVVEVIDVPNSGSWTSRLHTLDADGSVKHAGVTLGTANFFNSVAIAASGGVIGAAWQQSSSSELRFRTFNPASGQMLINAAVGLTGSFSAPISNPRVVKLPTSDWLVLWVDGRNGAGEVWGVRLAASGALINGTGRPVITLSGQTIVDLSAHAVGNEIALVHLSEPAAGGIGSVRLAFVDGTLTVTSPSTPVSPGGANVRAFSSTVSGANVAIGMTTLQGTNDYGVVYTERGRIGAPPCTSLVVRAPAAGAVLGAFPLLSGTARALPIQAPRPSDLLATVTLQRLGTCSEIGAELPLFAPPAVGVAYTAAFATGDTHHIAVWNDAAQGKLYRRLIGHRLCN